MNTTLTKRNDGETQLQPAGAGLPPLEVHFFRFGLPLLMRTLSRDAARKIFTREGNRVLFLAQDLKDWELEARILVKRPFGVEDNSRNWSMEMLMEHLMLTGVAVNKILRQLSAGGRPFQKLKLAVLRPRGERRPRVRDEFRRFLDKFVESADSLKFPPRPSFAHPSIGELSAPQWFKFAALHHWMHRIHAERIVAGIDRS